MSSTTSSTRKGELSQEFFRTVFTDAFIFREEPFAVLEKSKLSEDEKMLAIRIYRSSSYNDKTYDACVELVGRLDGIFHWQSNSEGPAVFCSKILYLLKLKKKDIEWFIAGLGREPTPYYPYY